MITRKLITKVLATLMLVALIVPASGCRRNRGYDFYDFGFDMSWIGFDVPSFFGGDEYYYEETFVSDGGYFDSFGYDEFSEEFYYEDWGGKSKKGAARTVSAKGR